MSVSSSNIDNTKDGVNKDNPSDAAQKNAAEQDVKITKTIQHLVIGELLISKAKR